MLRTLREPRASHDPIARIAFRNAFVAIALVLLAALMAAAVRLLPWALDPSIAWGTLAPFAKSLLAVAVEAAVLTGWPLGWAFAAQKLVERGEARVLASLGESPARTLTRLLPQALVFGVLLAATSLSMGREAIAPGRVVEALLSEGRAACQSPAAIEAHETHAVPFVSATWLCADPAPRLVGRAPFGGVMFTASDAHVTSDLRRVDLDDARLSLPTPAATSAVVRVRSLSLKGMTPWARASSLPPGLRAVVVTLAGGLAACAVVLAILRRFYRRTSGLVAVAMGASGPLLALGLLRWLELRVPTEAPTPFLWLAAFGLVPLAALLGVVASAAAAGFYRGKSSTLHRSEH